MSDFESDTMSGMDSDEESYLDDLLTGKYVADLNDLDDFSSDEEEPSTSTQPSQGRSRKRKHATSIAQRKPAKRKSTATPTCNWKSYDDVDDGVPPARLTNFKAKRDPGIVLTNIRTRQGVSTMTRAIDFFRLFFSIEVLGQLCMFTNEYARQHIHEKPSYATSSGDWKPVGVEEMEQLCGLLIYMGLVPLPDLELYFSTSFPYHGTWARAYLTKDRLKGILCFLKITDPNTEGDKDPLRKVNYLLKHMKETCKQLYQPGEHISIDERMVKSKGRFGFIQYIRDKPTKWGFKLWVLADSSNAYTYDFDVYVGRRTVSSKHGLGYDVVMELCKDLHHQGYKLYIDNFYTSTQLLKDLKRKGIFACGTIRCNRKGFPKEFKDTMKQWEKDTERGEMRWIRDEDVVVIQWKDKKVISVMSSYHPGNKNTHCTRNTRANGEHKEIKVKQPIAFAAYNKYMGGVDKSDQLIGNYNVLRKTNKYWKTLFYHMVDIAVVNSYILFCEMKKLHPGVSGFERKSRFLQRQFREELAMQLGGIKKDDPVPLYRPVTPVASKRSGAHDATSAMHLPVEDSEGRRRTCKVCYASKGNNANKSKMICSVCKVHLCTNRNCFYDFHTNPKYSSSLQ
ncbi:piggyBac transposable element-derived protein 4-like [Lytechinus variegatus]|uniref:piggyBac transposable element-derived protein 4-like n=1 Tax=Lytechinus variegatus TaxID=7654 RepID=UPI001BB0DA62|nr:piggyBac transposable element-derived protein 4-like [Lytechinus variegatus]XP_041474413.1 piggyBac transposable element-derived protein 4-like [Lytechinus variegatus]